MSPSPSSSSSSRWCPTPEQVMILEELYRSGIRTPNASQIQRITSHLSLYGKIEGKNVFYWFQNHKARDRQKLRRKLIKQLQQHQLCHHDHHHHLLGSFLDSPSTPPPPPPPLPLHATSSPFHPLSFHNSAASFLAHQGGSLEMMTHYPWKVEIPQMQNSMMEMYGQDWMMMMEVGLPSPCSATRPTLETLELFPITTTNLKEERNNKSSPLSTNNNSSSEIINFSL